MEEKDCWVGFSVFPGIGPVTFKALFSTFSSAKIAWHASPTELKKILKEKKTSDFVQFREGFDSKHYNKRLQEAGICTITLEDEIYPKSLKNIPRPPFVLYAKGNVDLLKESIKPTIAIIGTRKVSSYGRTVTEEFTKKLVAAGYIIISGFAVGVDTIAHTTTMQMKGKTIAVLGSGIDYCYPWENTKLYADIISSGGVILSEMPLGRKPTRGSFPARNRIVAGLAESILVTEATKNSGSLITAECGVTYGKKVVAVLGNPISSFAKGTDVLLRKGAMAVPNARQLLEKLGKTT
jgi:DNA processing protein